MSNTKDKIAVGKKQFPSIWGLLAMSGEKSHIWVEDKKKISTITKLGRVKFYRSKCGIKGYATDFAPLLESGTFDKCKRCSKYE